MQKNSLTEKSANKLDRLGALFITSWEGFSAYIYDDHKGAKSRLSKRSDAVGFATIGYGELIKSDSEFDTWKAQEPISKGLAIDLFRKHAIIYEAGVNTLKVLLNRNQFTACTSLCYNLGVTRFKSSQVAQALKRGDYQAAADKFLLYRLSKGKVLKGLERRRIAEKLLFINKINSVEEL